MHTPTSSRRRFLANTGGLASAGFLAAHWPAIAAAAEHADHSPGAGTVAPTTFQTLTVTEAADIEALTACIVPTDDKPGAREAKVVYFIDRALGTFYAAQLPAYRTGLVAFQRQFELGHGGRTFASAGAAEQGAFITTIETSPFFQSTRQLTAVGLVASPRYGGNFNKLGWQILGFDDQHVFTPPFGYYDKDYAGFVPYPGTDAAKAGA